MKQKIITMLELQDAMNSRVNPTWRQANYAWYRAIWTECAEMLEHYGWKWWKHHKPDMQQVRLEVVDIWHFTLSAELMRGLPVEQAATEIEQALRQPAKADSISEAIEELARTVIATKTADIRLFARLMQLCDMGFDGLYRTYVGKNVLNFFRQDHGYKDGTYQKIWAGREDNEHLAEIVATLDQESPSFSQDVYQALAAAYPE